MDEDAGRNDQIDCLVAVAKELRIQDQVAEVVSLFTALGTTNEGDLDVARMKLKAAGKMSAEEIDDLFDELVNEGFGSLDFFAFAMQNGIPQMAVAAAENRYKQMYAPKKLDLKQNLPPPLPPRPSEQKGAPATVRTFTEHLIHQFPLVSRQVENGLYSVKRVATYLKKICQFEEQYSKDVLKSTNHETTKLEKVQGDGMKRYINTWIGIQEVVYQTATQHASFRSDVMSAVVLPLQAFYKEAEGRRKELLVEMKGLSQEMSKMKSELKKTQQKAVQLLVSLKAAQDKEKGIVPQPAASGGGMFKKLAAKMSTLTQESADQLKPKAVAACEAYKVAIAEANKRKQKYRAQDLPRIFTDMQNLEIARLDVLKEHLTKFSLIYHELISPLEELSNRLVQNVSAMDTNEDINTFIDNWVAVHGEPPKVQLEKYDLPCSADDLRKNRWDGSMEVKVNSNSVFGVSLPEIMKIQKAKYPNEQLPVILKVLCKAIRDLRGAETEGIFRISPNKGELDQMHKKFDEGVYEVRTDSPHVPAALLKEWLRELSEPIIPDEHYQQCIVAAQDEKFNEQQALAVFQQLPELTRNVVSHIAGLLGDIIRHSNVNKMNVDNLAIVFAPSFLRCESDDPMEMLMNSKFETRFTTLLLKGLTA